MTVGAREVSPEEAQSIAAEFFSSGQTPASSCRMAIRTDVSSFVSENSQPYYIFNAEDNKGFVIISGDNRTQKILGYSDTGSFIEKNIPPQLKWLLAEYQKNIESLASDTPEPRQKISRTDAQVPLLSTQWGQSAPYNNRCPIINGVRAVTGCVATAMAQVVNYEKRTNHINEIPGYSCAVDMSTLPEYDFSFGELDDEGIATLMLYCGQSVRMNYGSDESGADAHNIPDALHRYFGWEEGVRLIERANFNDEHWNRMVKEEIEGGHPIIYSAVSETGAAHAFVIDGISEDLFHVNWGWDGNMDGYFSFQPLNSESQSEFIKMQCMVTTRDDDPSADVITYGTTIDGINYDLNDAELTASVLQLKNGEKYRGDLVIPSHINHNGKTYRVTYFGQNAFVNCGHLESISIPATIEGQEWSIFDGCVNLHKVNVEDMAAFIKLEVGGWWTGSPMHNGADLYLKGELVKDLVIPEGIENVGYCKFSNCTSIESITMPSTMKVAGQYSFSNCPNLKYVDMSRSSLELIDLLAFVNDESIVEITLPSTLKTVYEDAFGQVNGPGCKNLRKIISLAVTPPWSEHDKAFSGLHYSDAIVYVPDESVERYRQAKEWCKFLDIRPLSSEKPLPEIKTISCNGINYEIYISERYAKITGIYEGFSNSIPQSVEYDNQIYPVESVGYEGLYGATIEHIEAPLKKIGISSFRWTTFTSAFEIPATLTTITNRAFENATIPYLILPDHVEYIGSGAFAHERELGEFEHIYSIECQRPQPPVISDNTFDRITYDKTPLKVPYGSRKAYLNAPGWKNFKNISNIGDKQENILDRDLTLSASLTKDMDISDRMPLAISCNVRNSGQQKISGFVLSWYVDEKYVGEKNFEVELSQNEGYAFDDIIPVRVQQSGTHSVKLVVDINGYDDEDSTDNTVTLSFRSFDNRYYRVSLIEQYTSESCVFTPVHTPKIFTGIQNSGYSDFVAHVTHHCGFYDDFLTLNHDYEWFYNDYGTYTPAMMLNRSDISGTGYTPVNGISDSVDREIINVAGICDALVSVYCDVSDDKIQVKTLLEKNEDFDLGSGYDYITVFLVEDSIPSKAQVDAWSDGYVDYIHRNTVRKVLTGIWGDKIVWKDNICALKFETELESEWNPRNLKAVAFIHRYDPTSPVNCQIYTANSSILPQYGIVLPDEYYTTSLNTIRPESETFDIYNIMGVKVKSNASDFNGLPTGLYIYNGKKVYVK